MRFFEEIIQHAEFMHQLERRWMNRVAAKIPQKIRMLFQHHNVDAGACQQEPSIIPAGPPPAMQHRTRMGIKRRLSFERIFVAAEWRRADARGAVLPECVFTAKYPKYFVASRA